MSWKADKFQPLRDRARDRTPTTSMLAEARARQALSDSVTRELRGESEAQPGHDDWLDALVYRVLTREAAESARPDPFRAFAQTRAVAKNDDALTLDKLKAVKERLDAHHKLLRQEVEEQRVAREVARELRGEPEHDDILEPYAPAFRYASGLNVIRPNASVVCLTSV